METMKYQVVFFSNWHCGSGQTSGSDLDALVIKDADRLPFIPGKTIKGLLREAAANLLYYQEKSEEVVDELFGSIHCQGRLHFSNVTLSDALIQSLTMDQTISAAMLYQSFAATAIGDDGIAKDHSLRRIETVVPCTLYGEIAGFETEEQERLMEQALGLVKRLGLGRNRGYGRCTLSRVN